jgi:cyanophycin synthetase
MGAGDTTRTAKLTAWLLHLRGWTTGLSCADGLYLDQRCLQTKGGMDFDSAERLLVNRAVDATVFETDARHLLSEGLPYDRCQVGVVTRMPTAAGLEDLYAGEDDRMPGYIRTQIDVVLPTGTAVLNAEDEQVAELAQYSDGGVIFYASQEQAPRLQTHRAAGHRTAFWRNEHLVLADGAHETEVLSAQRPAVAKLLKDDRLDTGNILVAACVAWALETPAELIRAGVKSFGQGPASF